MAAPSNASVVGSVTVAYDVAVMVCVENVVQFTASRLYAHACVLKPVAVRCVA